MTPNEITDKIRYEIGEIFKGPLKVVSNEEFARVSIKQCKENMKDLWGDSVTFGDEWITDKEFGFDYVLKVKPFVTYTVEIDLKDFE